MVKGPIYISTVDQQLWLKHYGISINVEAYTDEKDVINKFISGNGGSRTTSCSQTTQFNDFTGFIGGMRGVPTRKDLKYSLQVLTTVKTILKCIFRRKALPVNGDVCRKYSRV
jgi:hypothetical protein